MTEEEALTSAETLTLQQTLDRSRWGERLVKGPCFCETSPLPGWPQRRPGPQTASAFASCRATLELVAHKPAAQAWLQPAACSEAGTEEVRCPRAQQPSWLVCANTNRREGGACCPVSLRKVAQHLAAGHVSVYLLLPTTEGKPPTFTLRCAARPCSCTAC